MIKNLKKILVPLDGSKNSLRGLKTALALAKPKQSTVEVLHILKIPSDGKISQVFLNSMKEKGQKIINFAQKLSKKEEIKFRGSVKTSSNLGKKITEFSHENKFDLIVMGSRGPDPSAEIFLGSVTNYVIHKAKIPVVVVK